MAKAMAFIKGAGKLAGALLLVALALSVCAWGYATWQARVRQEKEAPLAIKKQWETQQVLSVMPVDVATAWRNGRTYYQLTVSNYSEERFSLESNAALSLEFLDSDGFKLWEKHIPWDEMTRQTSRPDAGIEGFSWEGDEYTSADDYGRASRFDIVWRGLAPKPVVSATRPRPEQSLPEPSERSATPWRTLANWRKLAVGQSEDRVRALLGEPTNVERYGQNLHQWRYGDIVDGGQVSFTDGVVARWREPGR